MNRYRSGGTLKLKQKPKHTRLKPKPAREEEAYMRTKPQTAISFY
jgi:hypothetical protein